MGRRNGGSASQVRELVLLINAEHALIDVIAPSFVHVPRCLNSNRSDVAQDALEPDGPLRKSTTQQAAPSDDAAYQSHSSYVWTAIRLFVNPAMCSRWISDCGNR